MWLDLKILWRFFMKEYIEKEIKIKIANPIDAVTRLKSIGAKFEGGTFERTIRFDTPNHDLEKVGKFLRVRSGFNNVITMKEKIENDVNVRARKETEFKIEDIEKMEYIIKRLGYSYTTTMEKYRQMWKFDDCDITLDEMPFGVYMEIEGSEDKIIEICNTLGINQQERILETYWELWAKISDEKDIIFEGNHNFILKTIE